jgi:hypothetical protein
MASGLWDYDPTSRLCSELEQCGVFYLLFIILIGLPSFFFPFSFGIYNDILHLTRTEKGAKGVGLDQIFVLNFAIAMLLIQKAGGFLVL